MTIELKPETERRLRAQAQAGGMSLDKYVQIILERSADRHDERNKASAEGEPSRELPRNLSDLLFNSPFAGANLNLERSQDYPRPVEFE